MALKIKLKECDSCYLGGKCSKLNAAARIFLKDFKTKYGHNKDLLKDCEDALIYFKKCSCDLCKAAADAAKRDENIVKSDFKEILESYVDGFKLKFNGESPFLTNVDCNAIKLLLKQFSKEKVKFLIARYLSTDNDFYINVGYSLRHILNNVNSLFVSEMKQNSTLDWVKYISNEQLFEFLRLKYSNRWDPGIDGETLTAAYKQEIVKRNLNKKDFMNYLIKICDYETIQKLDKKETLNG